MVSLPVVVAVSCLLGAAAAGLLSRFAGVRLSDGLLVVAPVVGVLGVGVAAALGAVPVDPALAAALALVLVASFGVVRALDRPRGRWFRRLRARLLFGVPWGSLVSILGVLAFYLFVQGGADGLYSPLTLPFTSWSYTYPLGVLTAPFAHSGYGHLYGNLVGTVVLAPLAEYAFSHFPTERGDGSFSSLRANPYVRAFVLFPLGVALVGLATSVFAWGPVIGFSGVVFAFAAFALVRYPLAVVVALTVRSAVSTLYSALTDPVVVTSAGASYGGPWWAGVAVQGHFLGLTLGVLLGVLVLAKRDRGPSALRLFAGTVLFAASLSLWAWWWYRGPASYVLYRAVGVLFVLAVGWVVATAVRAGRSREPLGWGTDISRRQAGVLLVVVPLAVMAGVAAPINYTTTAGSGLPADAVDVRDYQVAYAETVPNQRVSAIDVSLFGESTSVNASGVIVYSDRRALWTEAVSAGRLAFTGSSTVRVGGIGWEATVTAQRVGWIAQGGGAAYAVYLKPGDGDWRHVYSSEPAMADLTLAGKNVSIVIRDGVFYVALTQGGAVVGTTPIPRSGSSTTLAGIRFRHTNRALVAVFDGTRVTVANEEAYS
ncbi:rhomboid family intramembrane serine protease [Salarchaeum sp. JOR-1]|uniref:rhomboid family intramembrane serine protease n=1 Tax=Salarchaeum sp. JOR-1 TaxID=2599399 RepID=UPI0011986258|nr:rhomboid family intramembrane serine protease [Salarchaeum sp. JOR-1]QDX41224.1 rhomboid family intramembrane serine protease [Salarchaeum sp. JOR-1]